MRQRTLSYFLGSLIGRPAIFAYGIAGGFTTAFQIYLLFTTNFSEIPTRTDSLPVYLELYIETRLPLWIPPVTRWNVVVLFIDVIGLLVVLLLWTASSADSS